MSVEFRHSFSPDLQLRIGAFLAHLRDRTRENKWNPIYINRSPSNFMNTLVKEFDLSDKFYKDFFLGCFTLGLDKPKVHTREESEAYDIRLFKYQGYRNRLAEEHPVDYGENQSLRLNKLQTAAVSLGSFFTRTLQYMENEQFAQRHPDGYAIGLRFLEAAMQGTKDTIASIYPPPPPPAFSTRG